MLQVKSEYSFKDKVELVKAYFTLLLGLNKIHLTNQELGVLAYAALEGEMTTVKAKTGVMNYFKIPQHSLNNVISKLQRKKLLIKTDRTRVIPALSLDYGKDLQLIINLNERPDNKESK